MDGSPINQFESLTTMTDSSKSLFVAVAGNIGAGKSSLTRILAGRFGWKPYFESVDDNPYLPDFYADMTRWSFHLQIYFLANRFKHHKRMTESGEPVIQDRSIYEDAEIFARNLHDIGKNLVAIMLKGAGFEVIDLGNDVSPERFITTAEKENANIIGMSALLTTTMPVMKKVIDLAYPLLNPAHLIIVKRKQYLKHLNWSIRSVSTSV